MDMRAMTEPIKATSIGLGVESNRKTRGMAWLTSVQSNTIHSSLNCAHVDAAVAMRKALFEFEDGKLHVDLGAGKHGERTGEITVEWCLVCPPQFGDKDEWEEWAACKGDFRGFSEVKKERDSFIEERCLSCPVQLECLEYGASSDEANTGGVWGGLYFQLNRHQRRVKIADQREKIRRGEVG